MAKVLLVGKNFALLAARAAVLARTGADVVASDPSELATHLGNERFDLVVLCHTLKDRARHTVIANAQQRWPQVRILQILQGTQDLDSADKHANAVTLAREPGELIAHAIELLAKSPNGKRQASPPAQLPTR